MAYARWQATIVDDNGNVISQPTIKVRREGTTNVEPLYWGRNGTEIGSNAGVMRGNPFIASPGEDPVYFHCAGGAFEITVTKGTFSKSWRYVAIGTAAESDVGSIVGSLGAVDNRVPRASGIGGVTLKPSALEVTDEGALVVPELAADPAAPAEVKSSHLSEGRPQAL